MTSKSMAEQYVAIATGVRRRRWSKGDGLWAFKLKRWTPALADRAKRR